MALPAPPSSGSEDVNWLGAGGDVGEGAAEAHGVVPGDLAIAEQIYPCEACHYCRRGQYWMCEVHDIYGFQREVADGAWATHMRFGTKSRVHRMPAGMPLQAGVLVEPLACALHGVERADVRLDDVVVLAYRACLEGVAFALRHNVEAGRDAGYPLDDVLHVVGGVARSEVWLEILAAVLGMPVVAATGGEAAYGDAMLAALGVGAATGDDLADWLRAANHQRRVEPDVAASAVYVGVPLEGASGELYGTLCCLSHSPEDALGDRDVQYMMVIADVLAEHLDAVEPAPGTAGGVACSPQWRARLGSSSGRARAFAEL